VDPSGGTGHDSHGAPNVALDMVRPVEAPETITCVDCGGRCHLLQVIDAENPGDETIAVYRCEDCLDRWDLVVPDDD